MLVIAATLATSADPDGTPKLLPVQGSSKPHPNELSPARTRYSLKFRRRSIGTESKNGKSGGPVMLDQ